MKFEILSFLPETTTYSFLLACARPQAGPPVKRDRPFPSFLFVIFLAVTLAATFHVSPAEASWFSLESEPGPVPPKKVEAEPIAPPEPQPSQADIFQAGIKEIADQLFVNLEDPDPQSGLLADGVAFTVFSDLKKLSRTSSFGRYLSEQLMGEFQRQGFAVVELRKSNSIMIMEKRGEYGLSRDPAEIGTAARARTMLTGTYTVAGDHIMVNAKILDHANSSMLSSATFLFEKNEMTEALLSDAASAYPKKDAYVYMKKLEL